MKSQAVFTQPDRPAGREMKLRAPPIKVAARDLGLPVHQPAKIRAPEALADFGGVAARRNCCRGLRAAPAQVPLVATAVGLHQHSRLALATSPRRCARSGRHLGRRQRNGHHHHASG